MLTNVKTNRMVSTKLIFYLPPQSCDLLMFVKENPDRKKKDQDVTLFS